MTKPATRTQTRENWLHAAIDMLRPMFVQIGFPIPERIHVSVGFSSRGRGGENSTIRGESWKRIASADGANHVFISPEIDDTATVLAVLMHELVHAALDNEDGHKGRFAEAVTRLGMTKPFTTATPDTALAAELIVMAAELGDYAHAKLDALGARKLVPVGQAPTGGGRIVTGPATQTNRHIKVSCAAHPEYSVRASRTVLEMGMPSCGICGGEMA
jgi:hypothetical protein